MKKEMRRKFRVLLFMMSLAISGILSWMAVAEDVPTEVLRMTKEEVKEMLDNSTVIIIDVRTDKAWEMSELKIKRAVREDPRNVNSWMDKYPKDKTLVFY